MSGGKFHGCTSKTPPCTEKSYIWGTHRRNGKLRGKSGRKSIFLGENEKKNFFVLIQWFNSMKKIRKRKKKKIDRNQRESVTHPISNHAQPCFTFSTREIVQLDIFFPFSCPQPTSDHGRRCLKTAEYFLVSSNSILYGTCGHLTSPTCILCFFSLYWLWHNLTRLPGKYAKVTPKSWRFVVAQNRWRNWHRPKYD